MHRLNCSVQLYGWGKPGASSKVAAYKAAQQADFQVDEGKNYAELWMGTHSNGPSQLVSPPLSLSDYLKQSGARVLGEKVSKHFYDGSDELKPGDLPFLFKVLSINQALSIQAHPTKEHGRILHARDPKNYPDPNHKPEMIIAISETFEGMCGFRPAQELAEHFKSIDELRALCGKENCDRFIQGQLANATDLRAVLKDAFTSMMNADAETLRAQFDSHLGRLQAIEVSKRTYLDSLFIRLAQTYPNDIGCFSIYLLNCIQLKKGEAIFLAANVPHAYLYGDGVECMACSDNVVRAGLTPKFKDVQVLCSMLDYTMRSSEETKQKPVKTALSSNQPYLDEFRPTVDEFSVQQIRIQKRDLQSSKRLLVPKSDSGSIVIIIESDPDLKSHLSASNESKLDTAVGLVYYLDAETDFYFEADGEVSGDNEVVFLAYRAYCDIKSS